MVHNPSLIEQALVKRLSVIAPLEERDKQALGRLPFSVRFMDAEEVIAQQGERPTHCCLLLEGWACRQRTALEGQQQILALHLPGDIVDLQSLFVPVMDHTLTTLTKARLACVPHAAMHQLLLQAPSLVGVFWRYTLVEAAVTRQWLASFGQLHAVERIAHLLCETYARLNSIGLVQNDAGRRRFPLPLTQMKLGQATGITAIHLNRSLQEMRARGLIKIGSGWVTILDWQQLQGLAIFDATYLSLDLQDEVAGTPVSSAATFTTPFEGHS